jgi:hypothetical protein
MKMKNIVLFTLLCGLCYGCTSDESLLVKDAAEAEPKEYTVSLSLGGEITSEDFPLSTKAETSSRDLYGVQVYKGSQFFAYGLFDNVDSMKITLLNGSYYNFVCTLVKNGKDALKRSPTYGIYYPQPFGVNLPSYIVDNSTTYYYEDAYYDNNSNLRPYLPICNNHFVYDTVNYHFNGLSSGASVLSNAFASLTNATRFDDATDYPQIDRFYGKLYGYRPTVNGTVEINMKRTAFGIKYKVLEIPDGTVEVYCTPGDGTGVIGIGWPFGRAWGLGANSETPGAIYTLHDIEAAWNGSSSPEFILVNVQWERNGLAFLGCSEVTVKRNAMNVIRISLNEDGLFSDPSFGITTENEAMSEENVEVPL